MRIGEWLPHQISFVPLFPCLPPTFSDLFFPSFNFLSSFACSNTGYQGLYLSDIQDHLITMTQNLNHYEKILSRSHSNYLAQISIEMTDANNQINDVLSKLTALGTVLIPMNLVTGVYPSSFNLFPFFFRVQMISNTERVLSMHSIGLWGMNVHVPGQNTEVHFFFPQSYLHIVTFLALFL